MFIDLSQGDSVDNFPISYSDIAPDLLASGNEEYKTTTLVLKKVTAGSFEMGSPENELGRDEANELQHQVTLSNDYYIGIIEITQAQWDNIYGLTIFGDSFEGNGDDRPFPATWERIRGKGESGEEFDYPNSGNTVDLNSFMGALRSKTNFDFDLPTEAQWEYACRAGESSALNSGSNLSSVDQDIGLDLIGRYGYNSGYLSETADELGGYDSYYSSVGSYLPNNWGIYDMHGNIAEWCLDWYEEDISLFTSDPVGPTSGFYRIKRGGSFREQASSEVATFSWTVT
jgi:formylglycine-generating enzyme required for sulfatase activity